MQGKGGITHSRLPAIEAASEVTGRNHRERARFRSELSDALASLPKLQGRRAADPALDRAVATLLSRVGPRLPPCLPPLPSKGSHVPPAQQTSLLTPGMTTMQRSYLHHPAAMRLSFFQVETRRRKPRDETTEYCEMVFQKRSLARLDPLNSQHNPLQLPWRQ
uniref:Uncharacterized protein n=1 Tax=Haptolina ericina TaxID=156174 RepID=A0A7S3BTT1_9EUKA|mmetsp:Transcript_67817/g.151452  ORF Transcript_67817/g.151452 Transcript_67817/m.151452 type:complete len:163 (+) Transcript_67817:36-524(+)